jgi:CheY-like chemotaxis protein
MSSSESSRPTPLGVARARFVDGLARKSQELRGSLALLAATPHEERPREELRRRLHALYASAQVFQLESLAAALKDGIVRLDQAREERASVSQDGLDSLASLAATLSLLGSQSPASDPAIVIPTAAPIPLVNRTSAPLAPPPPRSTYPGPAVVPTAVPLPERSIARPPLVDNELQFGRAPEVRAPEPKAEPAPVLKQKLAGSILERPMAPRSARPPVVSVLVLDGAEVVSRARSILPSDRFEVLGAADPEEALRLARSSSPDVVLVDQSLLASKAEFVRRLRDDPLTDFVPVVALSSEADFDPVRARELGALDAVKKPLEVGTLEPVLVRLGLGEGPRDPSGLGGDLTIEEIAGRVAEEIRRGLVESAEEGRDLSVPVGDGAEILAATWAAIGRMRAHLAVRSGGRVHFREKGSGPAFLALTDEDTGTEDHVEVSLRDRRVIVVDDDPAVVWFFAGLLREAGADVQEADDGLQALDLARRVRPDVIISDILMPGLDGFALLRELQRDPVLADVPVILLSWKEDFLQRMRELQSGASGYLRKEAGAAQILASVRDVLRPRARLESRLRAGGEVRGRLARVGPIALLKTVAQLRPDARVTVRDAWNLFEIDLRAVDGKGQLIDVTRTASDGSFSRGPRVVPSLLGATEGRFTVSDADAPVRGSVKEPLDVLLAQSAALLGGVVQAVSGKHLAHAHKVELDPDVLASVTRASPAHVTEVVDLLGEGHGPRALLLEGRVAPQVLEGVLVDLARQGAIVAVTGERGEDRIELARKERGETEIPMRTPSLAPPKRAPAAGTTPGLAGLGAIDPSTLRTSPGELLVSEEPTPVDLPAPDMAWLKSEETTESIVRQALRPEEEIVAEDRASQRPPAAAAKAAAAPKAVASATDASEPAAARPRLKNTVVGIEASATAKAPAARPASASVARPAPGKSAPGVMDGPLPWIAGIGLCALIGYVGYQALYTAPAAAGGDAEVSTVDNIDTIETDGLSPVALPDAPVEVVAPAPTRLATGFGVEEAGVSVSVGEGQGVLLFEGGTGALRAHITREDGSAEGEVMLASDDVTVVVAEGVYGVTFEAGEDLTVRFTRVAAGTTRRLPRP